MKIMAIDLGTARTGLAFSDLSGFLAGRSITVTEHARNRLLEAIRKKSEQAFHVTAGALLGSSLLLFAAFYPLESGLPCARAYAKHRRWFKWYNF